MSNDLNRPIAEAPKNWALNEDGTLTVTISAESVGLLDELRKGAMDNHPMLRAVREHTRDLIGKFRAEEKHTQADDLQGMLDKLEGSTCEPEYTRTIESVIKAAHIGMGKVHDIRRASEGDSTMRVGGLFGPSPLDAFFGHGRGE